MIDKHEYYSVMITDDINHKRGTGTLYYSKGSAHFYVMTCAHVVYLSNEVSIHILIPGDGDPEEKIVLAKKDQFHYSPIDNVEIVQNESTHSCDIAIIKCEVGNLSIIPTQFSMFPMTKLKRVIACGYPIAEGPLFYQLDTLTASVEKTSDKENYFLIRVRDTFLNASDRESELEGFSGSPVWDAEKADKGIYLFGGLIASGMTTNVNRGRIKVMNAMLIRSLMKDEFGINIEIRIPGIPDSDIAPGYELQDENKDIVSIRDTWVGNERKKAQTYLDNLQLKKAIEVTRSAIINSQFIKCSVEQKYSIYAILLSSYRLARDYDTYDSVLSEMHKSGICSDREYLVEAIRHLEMHNLDKAEEYADTALRNTPDSNEAVVIKLAINAVKHNKVDVSTMATLVGSRDQLLIKPENDREEENIYQFIGYIFGIVLHENSRAIKCLNRAFQISSNFILLEQLGLYYYLHSIQNALLGEEKDTLDQTKIDQIALEKARDTFLCVISAADEMWLKGTIQRVGPQMFKCFYFSHDNFRVYKHYHDLMRYYNFVDKEMLRDIQICYLETAILKEPVNLDDYSGLTIFDKKYFEFLIMLNTFMKKLNTSIYYTALVSEQELSIFIDDAERKLQELTEARKNSRLGFDIIHNDFINLYGNGILRYHWKAITEVKKHAKAIVNSDGEEYFDVYLYELEADDIREIEKKYRELFEKKRDFHSFNEWCHFYMRHGKIEKTKELYDSVLNERSYLLESQQEFFYREYIQFYLENGYDLTVPIKCFVEHADDIKDDYLKLLYEMDLNLETLTLNNPDSMLEIAQILMEEGLIDQNNYNYKCLVINMMNCRPSEAEKYADPTHESNPYLATKYERMFFVWKGHTVTPDPRWYSMKELMKNKQAIDYYNDENWHRNIQDIVSELGTKKRKTIVIDLWALYYLQKNEKIHLMDSFEKIFLSHQTIYNALNEIIRVNDNDIRGVLNKLLTVQNIVIQSPTLKDQLEIRDLYPEYTELHQALLLSEILDCPAIIGEYRQSIPERFKKRIIRPNQCYGLVQIISEGQPM